METLKALQKQKLKTQPPQVENENNTHKAAALSYTQAKAIFMQAAHAHAQTTGCPSFVVDDENKPVLAQLVHYFAQTGGSNLSTKKGVLLVSVEAILKAGMSSSSSRSALFSP